MSRPFVREVTPKRLFFKDCPRYPEVPSAKSRVGVRDIPIRPGAISDQIQNKRRKASGYRGHWPAKSRDIADAGPAKAREITDAANRLGISRTKRKARDIADATPRAPPPVWAEPTPPVGGTGWVEPLEWRGRPCDAGGGQACLLSTDPGAY
jgi:hypothetical protein